jgi:mono/diheme cytochrome c family protein
MPSTILRRGGVLSLVAAALTTITLTACGGDSSSGDTGTSGTSSAPAPASTGAAPASTGAATTSGGGGGAADAEGAKIFASAGCASCHTLKAADSNGQVGPNLDDLKPDEATVEKQVTNGGGGMPAFKDSLSPEEIKAVSTYVADNAGT